MSSVNPEREARRRGAPSDPLRLFQQNFRLFAICRRLGCAHRRELQVALLVRAFPPAVTLAQVASRLTCSHCGQRGPRIKAQYVGRRGDGR